MQPPPAKAPKRSLKAPLIGLGAGAALLGSFAWMSSGTVCTEGRIVENPAQCNNLVGWQYGRLCEAAFSVSPATEQIGIIDRAAFVTKRENAEPGVESVIRRAGDPKWRKAFSNDVAEPFRQNCTSSRSSSSSSGSGGHGGSGSSSSGGDSGTHAVARGGFGGTGLGFFSGGG